MSEYEELLDKFDKSDMAGWTRRFFDDLESAFQETSASSKKMIGTAYSA